MNYKLLFPTYRNRYLFVRRNLAKWSQKRSFEHALNLGCGEGDYDPMIASYCQKLDSVDINEADVNFARLSNQAVDNIEYRVDNALKLKLSDNSIDLLVSVEVLEHVGKPEVMVQEIQRVLKPGGLAILTFPSLGFPFTYDPINRLLGFFSTKKISQGAYAFGHDYLIDAKAFRQWAEENGLEVLEEHHLSGYLIGLLEMYWTGIIQSIFKANATNQSAGKEKKALLRPTNKEPWLVKVTDLIIQIDQVLFGRSKHSVGKGIILIKK